MKKTLGVTILLLFLSAGWLMAQQASPQQSGAAQGRADQVSQKAGDEKGQKAVFQGCLSQSADNFLLADDKGNSYQLEGDKSELSKYVGQQVEIKGSISKSAASKEMPENEKAGSVPASQLLKVSSIKKVADSCASPQAPPK